MSKEKEYKSVKIHLQIYNSIVKVCTAKGYKIGAFLEFAALEKIKKEIKK